MAQSIPWPPSDVQANDEQGTAITNALQGTDPLNQHAKILWGEGLFLRPQLFQQQDGYHESRLNRMSRLLQPYAWGIQHLKIDKPSLAQGTLRLLEVSAVFPGGEMYAAPEGATLPPALALQDLPVGVSEVTAYLALPRLAPYGRNLTASNTTANAGRYEQANEQTPDLFTDAAEGEVAYLIPAVRLLTEDQAQDAFEVIAVARLKRSSTGGFEVDDQYMTPSVNLDAMPNLQLKLRQLLEALSAKVQGMQETHREPSKDIVEFRAGDIASFWLLHTSNTACASLSHLFQHPGLHPERVYQELLRLAGALLTFSKTHQLADLPPYEHTNPGPGFNTLFSIIHALVDTVISARYFSIPLVQVKPAYHQGRLDNERIDASATLYLGVAAEMAGTELAEAVPRTVKLGSPDIVEKLVTSSMPGVTLSYTPVPPSAIPVRPGMLYFAVEPRGAIYDQMLKSQTVTVFIPNGLPELKLELIALMP